MTEEFTPNVNDIIEGNARFVAGFHEPDLGVQPTRNVAVIACMDSRMDIFALLGLANGESHIIRNGGGVITDDVIRSLCLSQRKLGTREVILVHHTDCGLQTVTEDSFKAELEDELGIKPWWALESFVDPYADVTQSIARLELSPFIPYKDNIHGFVYDVTTGQLNLSLIHISEPTRPY